MVAPYLWQNKIEKLDYVVNTHADADHVNGLVYLVKNFDIGEIWTNELKNETAI